LWFGPAVPFNEVIAELNRALGTRLQPDYIDNPYPFYQPHTEADMTKAANELKRIPYTAARGISEYVARSKVEP
jgi:ADP-L-glycero-D-manno-heptose 6-epimerase